MTNKTPFDRTYVDYLVTPNFWFSELISSETAERNRINNYQFDQIICEFNSWVHIAWKSPTGEQRGQILTAKKINGKTQYLAGLVK